MTKTKKTTQTTLNRTIGAAAAALLLAFGAGAALAAGPSGFAGGPSSAPQGFGPTAPSTVAQVLENGQDDQHVVLQGKFTKHIRGERYEFVDASGKSITAELDHDRDWSMIVKDQPVEIFAEVDRDWNSIELDVKSARAMK